MDYRDIVNKILSGDRTAERELFNALAPRLMTMCLRYAKDHASAKDYLQDCFIRAFDKLDKYDGEQGKFESWFFKLSLNVILSSIRAEKRKLNISYVEDIPERVLEESDLDLLSDRELLQCIRQLPEGYKNVLNLYVFENLSHKEIASLLGITESTSRSQYMRAKNLLKQILKKRIPNIYERKLA